MQQLLSTVTLPRRQGLCHGHQGTEGSWGSEEACGEFSLIAMCRGLHSCCGGGAYLYLPQTDFSLHITSGGGAPLTLWLVASLEKQKYIKQATTKHIG